MDKEAFRKRIKSAHSGFEARHLFLAWAFLRGVPYRVLEMKVRQHHEPRPTYIYEFATGKDYPGDSSVLDPICAWLEVPATPEMTERALRLREDFLHRKTQRAKAIRSERAAKELIDDAPVGK